MQRNALLNTRVDTIRAPLKNIQVDRGYEGKDVKASEKTPQNSSKKKFKSPPKLMIDKKGKTTYTLGELLGEGGFARCYLVNDVNGSQLAAKVVPKLSLKSLKQKQKLIAEIKIHQGLNHENIVRYKHVFEDDENVYIILELCENGTFVDLLKRRKILSEPEVRFYMYQLLDGIRYMHRKSIIHRDLKLGNLFLTKDLTLKIGDFGLAASLKHDGERKKTICGTPNYIAPEILFDTKNGHSFEVDIWSLGVVMYTMLVGRPPFQTKDVKTIYKKIRENSYEFPPSIPISANAKSIIASLLTSRPESRPSVDDVINHEFFQSPPIIKSLPLSALHTPPKFGDQMPELVEVSSTASSELRRTIVKMESSNVSENSCKQGEANKNILQYIQNSCENSCPQERLKPRDLQTVNPTQRVYQASPVRSPLPLPPIQSPKRVFSSLEVIHENMSIALNKQEKGQTFGMNNLCIHDKKPAHPSLFITKWIDYSNKYGLGYQLRDGSVGVYFNDSTSIILASDSIHFEYLYYDRAQDRTSMQKVSHTVNDFPSYLAKKVTLLKHFRSYMHENLNKAVQNPASIDDARISNLHFLTKYLRTKHGVLFRLSNQILQLNLFDHTKIILSNHGQTVSYIDKNRDMHTDTIERILQGHGQDVHNRLTYLRDVIKQMIEKKRRE